MTQAADTSHSMSSDDEDLNLDLFQEPAGYRQERSTEKKNMQYTMLDGTTLDLQLIGYDTLWSNFIWNAGRVLAQHFEQHPGLVQGKAVLELGAGAALPSLVSALKGARTVVATDYPDRDVLASLALNVDRIRPLIGAASSVHVKGLCWGNSVAEIRALLPDAAGIAEDENNGDTGFDVLVLADLLFNHSEHGKMLSTVAATMKKSKTARAYVFFTPYRPWLLAKDLAFFEQAAQMGFVVEDMFDTLLEKPMEEFKNDRGDEELRRTVFGRSLRWADVELATSNGA